MKKKHNSTQTNKKQNEINIKMKQMRTKHTMIKEIKNKNKKRT